jgi:hypothetical protein
MVPDIYTREKMAFEHHHTLPREAERERILADSPAPTASELERLVQSLGMYLIAPGTQLQHFGSVGKRLSFITSLTYKC